MKKNYSHIDDYKYTLPSKHNEFYFLVHTNPSSQKDKKDNIFVDIDNKNIFEVYSLFYNQGNYIKHKLGKNKLPIEDTKKQIDLIQYQEQLNSPAHQEKKKTYELKDIPKYYFCKKIPISKLVYIVNYSHNSDDSKNKLNINPIENNEYLQRQLPNTPQEKNDKGKEELYNSESSDTSFSNLFTPSPNNNYSLEQYASDWHFDDSYA